MIRKTRLAVAAAVAALWTAQSPTDSADARCDIYQKGADHTDKMIRCTFSHRAAPAL